MHKESLNYLRNRLSNFDSPYGRARATLPTGPPAGRSLTAWPNGLATLVDNASNPGAVVGAVDFNGAWVGSMDFIDDV